MRRRAIPHLIMAKKMGKTLAVPEPVEPLIREK